MKLDDYEVIDSEETSVGMLYLQERTIRANGRMLTEVMLDGALLMSTENVISECELATSALALHRTGNAGDTGTELSVLVGGLGLGYTAYEALRSDRVAELEVIDRLPKVGEWLRAGRLPLSKELGADDRLTLTEADVYASLLGPPTRKWDILMIDVDHAPRMRLHESSEPFYTVEGQRRVAEHVAPGGVVAVWSAQRDEPFSRVMTEVYPVAKTEILSWTCKSLGGRENTLFLGRLN